jgi:hypothetical protein
VGAGIGVAGSGGVASAVSVGVEVSVAVLNRATSNVGVGMVLEKAAIISPESQARRLKMMIKMA